MWGLQRAREDPRAPRLWTGNVPDEKLREPLAREVARRGGVVKPVHSSPVCAPRERRCPPPIHPPTAAADLGDPARVEARAPRLQPRAPAPAPPAPRWCPLHPRGGAPVPPSWHFPRSRAPVSRPVGAPLSRLRQIRARRPPRGCAPGPSFPRGGSAWAALPGGGRSSGSPAPRPGVA